MSGRRVTLGPFGHQIRHSGDAEADRSCTAHPLIIRLTHSLVSLL